MKINEVMKETGLTKKAIYYYENEGLIRPQKDPDNNYRNYTEEDVRRLVVINVLRRMDVPIKAIGDIINCAVPIKDVLKKQLTLTNRKINVLVQNKLIMNDLIQKEISEHDFSFETLKQFNQELDTLSVVSGLAGKELERIFPGTLGKTFAIFYSNFLNVPLDSEAKLSAWNDLVRMLDETKEIDFPEDVKNIIDVMYGESDDVTLAQWEKLSKKVIQERFKRETSSDLSEILKVREMLADYYADPENRSKIEGYQKLRSFIVTHMDLFLEIDKYVCIINEEYINYMNVMWKEIRIEEVENARIEWK
jgi:DNA-binding transcriptional MerR regulator